MYVVRRFAALIVTVVLAPCVSFVVFDTLQQDHVAPLETLRELRAWLERLLLHGDLGDSGWYRTDMTEVIRLGLPADLTMLIGGLVLGLAGGVVFGLIAVAHPRSLLQRCLDLVAGLGVSMPIYWMGFVVLILFAHNSGLILMVPFVSGQADFEELPSDPLAFVQALWVPIVVCATPIAASVYRMTIAASRDVLGEDFVRTAQAKGLRRRHVLSRHVFPVASIPVLVMTAAQVNLLIMNVSLMQVAFNIPGSFREVQRALANGNIETMQALVLYGCVIIALANLAADLLQARLDPRVRESLA
jgi:ABC-type dipeptide/oligopeptide/nickel transport system permease component